MVRRFETRVNAGPRQAKVSVTGEKIKIIPKKVSNRKALGLYQSVSAADGSTATHRLKSLNIDA